MDWAAWGPTISTITAYIFFAGVLWNTQRGQEKRLNEHDDQLSDHTRDITNNSLDIRELKAFQQGYATARQIYENGKPHHGP